MILNIKKIKPMFNQVITTMDKYSDEELKVGGIIDSTRAKRPIKEFQRVVAIGPTVRNVNVGDLILINPRRYEVKKYEEGSLKDGVVAENEVLKYKFNTVTLNHIPHLIIYDNDIEYVVEEYEEEPEDTGIIMPNNDIIAG